MELLVCTKQVPDDSVSVSLNAAGQPALDGITVLAGKVEVAPGGCTFIVI
jgi:hypothetical protein